MTRHARLLVGVGLIALGLVALLLLVPNGSRLALAQPPAQKTQKPKPPPPSSPRADRATRVFWGDQHLHTSFSPDAGLVGNKLGPAEAYQFARGMEIKASGGKLVKLDRALDWLVVSDHAEYHGLPQAFAAKDPAILKTPTGKKWAADLKKGGRAGYQAFVEMTKEFADGKPSIPKEALESVYRKSWEEAIAAAEQYNVPGKFSAFVGFEWTQSIDGNNLHRVVMFRDGADRLKKVLPFSEFDSTQPEDLWSYMADYEKNTGGRVLAIEHNPNLSGGTMFATKTTTGEPFTRQYAEMRARFDRLAEVTQSKGDSETTPRLSPDDPFADFERWDKTNIFGMVATTPEMLPFNYVRSALQLGLEQGAKLGVNPFKFGMIGGSDQHSSLVTTRADNYFGVAPIDAPKPNRWKEPFLKSPVSSKLDMYMWEMLPGGLGGVWARENTREAIFDALYRREVYATTGTRPTVRVFGGWNFVTEDLKKPEAEWVELGYSKGVPMGGDLTNPPKSGFPTFMVKAAHDPAGAYLDRVQIVKGWRDSKGALHEQVHDVAWSGERQRDAKTGMVPAVGSTVDVKNATWTNTIGAQELSAVWLDISFDPAQQAFYYVRVIEIPTPRWTAYDAKRFGVKMDSKIPMIVTNRAYTSPIWYSPAPGQQTAKR